MISFAFAILILSLVTNILLGLLVILRNPKSSTNRIFFALVLAMSVWGTLSYMSNNNSNTLLLARFVLFFAVIFATFFFFFVLTFPSRNDVVSAKFARLIYVWSLVVMAVTLTPLCFKYIRPGTNGEVGSPVVGPGIALFGLTALFYDFGGLIILAKKTIKSRGRERSRRLYLWAGLATMLILIILSQFILPSFYSNTTFIPYATVFILPFISATTYAIIAQKLFDIKAVVARSMTYLFSIGTVVLVYSLSTIGILNYLLQGQEYELVRSLISVVLAGILAISFQALKRFFDRLTNHIFYRDAYEIQSVLDELGSILVAEIELKKILGSTRQILTDAMKSSFIEFLLFRAGKPSLDFPDVNGLNVTGLEYIQTVKDYHKDIIVTDELDISSKLYRNLTELNISVVLRLKTHNQVVGFIFLGDKKSGDIYGTQDISLLSIIANELAVTIQNAMRFEEIQQFNITLQQKVDEATKQLRSANEKLKALDETKDEFISMASHQLRTPLTAVKGYLSMVLEGDAGKVPKEQKPLLGQSFASAQRMVYLISDLLNVSRLKTGKFVIDNAPTNLADVVEGEIEQLIETAKGRGLELTYNKPKIFPTLMLDENKIRQVIMNFTDNAIYYTPSGGHILVNLAETSQAIELTVVDDGIGVPKSEQHHLFSKFYRAGNAKKARPDGTGLGLFMAKKVVVAQGGAIIFKTQEGKGSTFGFSFPKEKLKVPDHIKPKKEQKTEKKEPSLI